MITYEYKIYSPSIHSSFSIEEKINEFGKDGFRFVREINGNRLIFMKEIDTTLDELLDKFGLEVGK